MKTRLALAAAVAGGLGAFTWAAMAQPAPTWANVAPIFADNCVRCHGSGGRAGLNLSSYATAIAGSNNGPVLIAGDPTNSLLMRRIRGEVTPQMPRGAPPLSDADIALIAAWIAGGLQP